MDKTLVGPLTELVGPMGFIELLQLKAGWKQVCRITLNQAKEKALQNLLIKLHLTYHRSSLSIKKLSASTQLAVFNSNEKRGQNEPIDYIYYITTKGELALLASVAELTNPGLLGYLLGYPPCCTKHYLTHFSPVNADITRTVGIPSSGRPCYLINRTAKLFGYSLISHFPCSWDCEGSIKLAQNTIQLLDEISPALLNTCTDLQNCNVFYSTQHTVFTKNNATRIKYPGDVYREYGHRKGIIELNVADTNYHYIPFQF